MLGRGHAGGARYCISRHDNDVHYDFHHLDDDAVGDEYDHYDFHYIDDDAGGDEYDLHVDHVVHPDVYHDVHHATMDC